MPLASSVYETNPFPPRSLELLSCVVLNLGGSVSVPRAALFEMITCGYKYEISVTDNPNSDHITYAVCKKPVWVYMDRLSALVEHYTVRTGKPPARLRLGARVVKELDRHFPMHVDPRITKDMPTVRTVMGIPFITTDDAPDELIEVVEQ